MNIVPNLEEEELAGTVLPRIRETTSYLYTPGSRWKGRCGKEYVIYLYKKNIRHAPKVHYGSYATVIVCVL